MTSQYQSFPGASGDSRTLDKLKALQMPDLAGRSFLDVGCNEGFFCGFAKFLGAGRVVGLDHGAAFVERARRRFPDCEFLRQGWERLPEERFDVILLASALHYADDQPALIARLVDRLAPGGVLVLELGIVSSTQSEWVKVQRGIDERLFPTMDKLRELLAGYAWKWMGPSVSQDGDPVKRHVLHISKRLPIAYLLLEPPGYGKTTLAKGLFPAAGVKLVSGDQLLGQVGRGKREAPERLRDVIVQDFSPFRMDQTLERIFREKLCPELVALWLGDAGEGDFALDVYVPASHHDEVEQALVDAGYLPVQLRWEKVGPRLLPKDTLSERAEAFYLSMVTPEEAAPSRPQVAAGFVDEVTLGNGRLEIRGWAITRAGNLPRQLLVRAAGREFALDTFEKQLRPDVQAHLKLSHALFGYRASIALDGVNAPADLVGGVWVAGRDDADATIVFQFSEPAARWAPPRPGK